MVRVVGGRIVKEAGVARQRVEERGGVEEEAGGGRPLRCRWVVLVRSVRLGFVEPEGKGEFEKQWKYGNDNIYYNYSYYFHLCKKM